MTTSETKLCYVPYDVLRDNKDIPKSFFWFWWWLLRSMGRGLKKGFPMNLLAPLIVIVVYTVLNVVYMGVVNDTMYFKFAEKSILAYIFSGIVIDDRIKGFDLFHNGVKSIYWTIPMLFLLTSLIFGIFRRIRQNGFKSFMSDIIGSGNTAKLYAMASTKSISSHILLGVFWGSIIGFLVQSPVILFLLPIILFLSFTLRENGKLIGILSMFLISINIKRKNPKYVNIANIALAVLGLAVGFAFYFCVVMIMWYVFNYSIFARVIFTVILAAASFLLYKVRNNKLKSSTANLMIMMIFVAGILALASLAAYADDGGWSESGENIVGWLSNPGTKLLAALGLEGSAGTALGWIADTALGGILPALGLGEALQAAQVLCGAGSPQSLGQAALGAALGPLGPLGSAIADAAGGIGDALAGNEGGGAGGSGENSGSSGSGGSGGGGGGYSGGESSSGYGNSGGSGSSSGNSPNGSSSSDGGSSSADGGSGGSGGAGEGSSSGDAGSGGNGNFGAGSSGGDGDSSSTSSSGSSAGDGSLSEGSSGDNGDSGGSSGTIGGSSSNHGYPTGNGDAGNAGGSEDNSVDDDTDIEEDEKEMKKKGAGGAVSPGEKDGR